MWGASRKRSWRSNCLRHCYEAHFFPWLDASINKTCATGMTPIPENCIKGLCIHQKSPLSISSTGIVGPWLFEGYSNSEFWQVCTEWPYMNILKKLFLTRIDELGLDDFWFQQDGATTHTSRASIAVLREHFPERIIPIRGDLVWPARFPDLSPTILKFCGYIRNSLCMSTVPLFLIILIINMYSIFFKWTPTQRQCINFLLTLSIR